MNYYTDVLKQYTKFAGRTRRKEYWMFVLWNFIISVILMLAFALIDEAINSHVLVVIPWIYFLAVIIPTLAVFVRRLHDTGRTGWWFFLGLIPFVGPIVLLVFLVQDSKPGDNKYGPNPKGIASTNVSA